MEYSIRTQDFRYTAWLPWRNTDIDEYGPHYPGAYAADWDNPLGQALFDNRLLNPFAFDSSELVSSFDLSPLYQNVSGSLYSTLKSEVISWYNN